MNRLELFILCASAATAHAETCEVASIKPGPPNDRAFLIRLQKTPASASWNIFEN